MENPSKHTIEWTKSFTTIAKVLDMNRRDIWPWKSTFHFTITIGLKAFLQLQLFATLFVKLIHLTVNLYNLRYWGLKILLLYEHFRQLLSKYPSGVFQRWSQKCFWNLSIKFQSSVFMLQLQQQQSIYYL